MALHGLIQVNGMTIGSWEAVRKEEDEFDEGLFRYQCEVRKQHGDALHPLPVADRWEFSIWHQYDDGALLLAAKVLAFTDQFGPEIVVD